MIIRIPSGIHFTLKLLKRQSVQFWIQEQAKWSLYKFRKYLPIFKQIIIRLYKIFTSLVHKCIEVGIDIHPKLFLYLGVVSSSEDDEEVPLLSLSFWDDLVLLPAVKFRISAYGNCFFSCIYEWEQSNKNSEDNYEDRGFWDSNCLNFPQQKTVLAYS